MASTVQRFDRGSMARFGVVFRDITAAPADPSVVTFSLLAPDLTVTTYTYLATADIVKVSTGVYFLDFVLPASGRWSYRWQGTGTIAAVFEGSMYVEQSAFV